jgi:hypothetical protein
LSLSLLVAATLFLLLLQYSSQLSLLVDLLNKLDLSRVA